MRIALLAGMVATTLVHDGEPVEQMLPGNRPPPRIVASFDGLGVGFEGPQGTASLRNPSDNTLAVGRDHVFQIVNTRMAIFTRTGTDSGRSVSLPVRRAVNPLRFPIRHRTAARRPGRQAHAPAGLPPDRPAGVHPRHPLDQYRPGQRFAGRQPGDPLGQLTLAEAILVEGEAAQVGTPPEWRNLGWQDYTQTAVDPLDDCTIWYVGDYLKKGATTYSTRIGAFRMPGCR